LPDCKPKLTAKGSFTVAKAKGRKKLSGLRQRLRKHLKADPAKLPVLEQEFATYERPNIHLSIENVLADSASPPELCGVVQQYDHQAVRLAKLSHEITAGDYGEGPVEYVDIPLAGGQQLACVKLGLFLIHSSAGPLALLVTEERYFRGGLVVEVMAANRDLAEQFLRRLNRQVKHGGAFRGQVLTVEEDCHGNLRVHFQHLPKVRREDIILPESLLQRIERHTVGFSRHAEKLRSAGRHLKRGILLHGPPGTGKTLSAMYLAAQMPGRTVLIMTGGSIRALESTCKLARMLTPATIILEDVDLIGTERQHQTVGANQLLFELLNQMDGLADDADLLFVLTTNRPDILEPALAARPGRIDQAIEVTPPDADCRRRLLQLYGRGLTTEGIDWSQLVARTAGASGAFIRELLRKAAVFAAEDGANGELVIRQPHVEEALTELLVAGGALTQSLLGARPTDGDGE
jgi:AAA+ superfamily predicted ATPase